MSEAGSPQLFFQQGPGADRNFESRVNREFVVREQIAEKPIASYPFAVSTKSCQINTSVWLFSAEIWSPPRIVKQSSYVQYKDLSKLTIPISTTNETGYREGSVCLWIPLKASLDKERCHLTRVFLNLAARNPAGGLATQKAFHQGMLMSGKEPRASTARAMTNPEKTSKTWPQSRKNNGIIWSFPIYSKTICYQFFLCYY